MAENISKTYFAKRNDFSEAHYQLPPNYCMFDIDFCRGEWLNLEVESTKDNATYVEYRCLHFDNNNNKFNVDRIKFVAIFELKHNGTSSVKEKIKGLEVGSPLWATFMLSKLIKCRFFVVVATNGKQPYHFIEYDENGKYNYVGTFKHKENDIKESINNFWNNVLKINE